MKKTDKMSITKNQPIVQKKCLLKQARGTETNKRKKTFTKHKNINGDYNFFKRHPCN